MLPGLAVRRAEREETPRAHAIRRSAAPFLAAWHELDLVKRRHLLDAGTAPQLAPPPDEAIDAARDVEERAGPRGRGREGRGGRGEGEGDVWVEERERGEGRAQRGEEGGLRGGFG